MKKLILALVMLSATICQAQSQTTERDLLIQNLAEVTRSSSLQAVKLSFGGNYGRMLEADKKHNPDATADTWNQVSKEYEAEVERIFSQPGGFTTLVAKEIAADLNDNELRQVIAFLGSDAGKKYTNSSSERVRKLFASNQFKALFSFSILDMYSAKATLMSKHSLKLAPLELQGNK